MRPLKIDDRLFDLAAFLLVLRSCIGDSSLFSGINGAVGKLISGAVILLLVILIIREKHGKRMLVMMLILGTASIYTSIVIKSNWLVYLWLISFALINRKLDRAIRIFFWTEAALLTVHAIVFGYKYITDRASLKIVANTVGRPRYLVFFATQNKVAQYFIFIVLEYLYLFKESLSKIKWLLIWGASFVVWYFTGSDAIIMCIAAVSFLYIFADMKLIRAFIKLFSKYGFPLLSVIYIVLAVTANVPGFNIVYRWVNSFITGRLALGNQAINMYGFTFLGQNSQFGRFFTYNGKSVWYLFVDNAYLYFSVHTGWFYLIVLSLLFIMAADNLDNKSKVLLCVYYLYAMAENTIIYTITFVPVLIAVNGIVNAGSKSGLEGGCKCRMAFNYVKDALIKYRRVSNN